MTVALPACSVEADLFVSFEVSDHTVNRLAATYCDSCPIRGDCYRGALRDRRATGVYGGVLFLRGVPVPPRRSEEHGLTGGAA